MDGVKAKLENGVLRINLAKLSPDKIKGPRIVSVEGVDGSEMPKVGSSNDYDKKQEL